MSLWPISTVPNCIPYHLWDGVTSPMYHPDLVTPPRIYDETIAGISHWYYEPGNDRLCLWASLYKCSSPGWTVYRYDFDAATGAYLGKTVGSIWAISWVNHAGLGSYDSIYATWKSDYRVTEMDPDIMWPQTGMWSIDPSDWSPSIVFSHAVVNREDGLIVGVSSWGLQIWDINSTPLRIGTLRLPYTLGYLCYESREIAWIITSNGLMGKINYKQNPPRWEMLSSVQNPDPATKGYFSAFDPNRKRLAVFRWLPDAADGSCQSQIEFYQPLYRVAGLTDPVPVSRLRTGENVRFVSHLYGENGEGVGTYLVTATLGAPAAGEVLTPASGAEQSGRVTFRYHAPATPGTDTLIVSATITDGD